MSNIPAKNQRKLTVHDISTILLLPLRRYLVKGLLGLAELSVWYGAPGCGKSFLLMYLGLCIAQGLPFFGKKTTQGGVIYVAAEGTGGFSSRLAAYIKRYGLDENASFYLIPMVIDLAKPGADVGLVIQEINNRAGTRLLIVDTVARVLGEADEDAEGFGALIRNCDAIRLATGVHVCLVHHSGKDTSRGARGHSSLLGAVDTSIEVVREDSSRSIRIEKQKDGQDGLWVSFTLDVVDLEEDEDGETTSSCVVRQADESEIRKGKARLRGQKKIAFDAIAHLFINKLDQPIHGLPGIPPSVKNGVDVAAWKAEAIRRGLCDIDTKEDGRRKAFLRAKIALRDTGHVAFMQSGDKEFAWLMGHETSPIHVHMVPDDK